MARRKMTAAEKEAFKKRMAAGRKKAAGKKGKRRAKKTGTRKKTSRKKAPKRRKKASSACAPRKKSRSALAVARREYRAAEKFDRLDNARMRKTKRKTKRKAYKAKGQYKHGPRGQITAAQIINGASKAQLAAWICAGARRTGCGGGKRGGHVVMSTTLDAKTSRKFRRRLSA